MARYRAAIPTFREAVPRDVGFAPASLDDAAHRAVKLYRNRRIAAVACPRAAEEQSSAASSSSKPET
ncbi:MAG: hypothetical protein K9G48_08950 [Reyranella sp.]|nr:hypothetical protein [Reyranella sp.]